MRAIGYSIHGRIDPPPARKAPRDAIRCAFCVPPAGFGQHARRAPIALGGGS
jgi:hypothetical protein